jgi:hypothetical protein
MYRRFMRLKLQSIIKALDLEEWSASCPGKNVKCVLVASGLNGVEVGSEMEISPRRNLIHDA